MGNFVPPAQTEDPLETTDVEGLKGFDVTSVQDPGFATVQKDRYTDGIGNGRSPLLPDFIRHSAISREG